MTSRTMLYSKADIWEATMKRSGVIATTAMLLLASSFAALSQDGVSDGVVKIGMLEDMSSIYADITGMGAVTAAKMAVEDFGGKVLGKPIESRRRGSSEQTGYCFCYCAGMVRHPARRCAHGCRRFGDRARCYRACQDQKQDRRSQWARRDAHHQRGMHADLDPLHV